MAIDTSAGSTYGLMDGMSSMTGSAGAPTIHYVFGSPEDNLTAQNPSGSDIAIDIENNEYYTGIAGVGGSEWFKLGSVE